MIGATVASGIRPGSRRRDAVEVAAARNSASCALIPSRRPAWPPPMARRSSQETSNQTVRHRCRMATPRMRHHRRPDGQRGGLGQDRAPRPARIRWASSTTASPRSAPCRCARRCGPATARGQGTADRPVPMPSCGSKTTPRLRRRAPRPRHASDGQAEPRRLAGLRRRVQLRRYAGRAHTAVS